MEDRLRRLVAGNAEVSRAKGALAWKRQGRKVIGVLCSYVPEEVIYAAGMLAWRVTGTWRESTPLALVYRPANSCQYCTHVLESLLSGELDFLDGVVATSSEQDLVRLWDVWVHLGKTPFAHILHLPHQDSELAYSALAGGIRGFISALERFGGQEITPEALRRGIEVCNKTRQLLGRLYELRKREVPPLSGAEVLGITTAAGVMPREEFNRELGEMLPYLETRKPSLSKLHPRLLVSSDNLDNPAFVEVIEGVGCVVAMDDLDTGARHFWGEVDGAQNDLTYALARRYISHPGSPRMFSWPSQVHQVIEWVRDFSIDGVVELPQMFSRPREMRVPFFTSRLTQAGVPNISLGRDYHLSNVAQLKTRVGAFLEMLQARPGGRSST